MKSQPISNKPISNKKILKEYDLHIRNPSNYIIKNLVYLIAFLWALFQLFIASPLPFTLAIDLNCKNIILNDIEARSIHLTFAILLTFLLFPATKHSSYTKVAFLDWILAIISSCTVFYIFYNYTALTERTALPTTIDSIVSICGILLLLEAARRTIGYPLVIVALLFLTYSMFGQYFPLIIAHKDFSLNAIASHEWLSSEGVFGVALGASTSFVFMYVLFGALLDKAGAGSFFIKLSFALLGRFTGGPAKAAIVASGLMGMISGSSIANTITIGTFTIPLMKKMGLTPEKSAAIEVSAGINGQIMPPVMGAAAFLMSEFLSIPYVSITKYALVPAVLVYITLLFIVHLEACKLRNKNNIPLRQKYYPFHLKLIITLLSTCCFILFFSIIYTLIEGISIFNITIPGIKLIFKSNSIYVVSLMLLVIYFAILYFQYRNKSHVNLSDIDEHHFPEIWTTFKSGLHYLIPISILVWCLTFERLSSALSCFWTVIFLIFMLLTQNIFQLLLSRKYYRLPKQIVLNFKNFYHAMISGSQNMISIAIATGTAGIIVGSISLTGFGLSISTLIDSLANGSLFITLVLTAIICIILGMGMPTTACYIIVSTLMVPVLKAVVYKNGLNIAPVSLHLFVFYFGLLADVTPPVGLAAYAAAAIARGNPFKTGVQSFIYNFRTMIIPFLFVFNNEIILYNVKNTWSSIWNAAFTILIALISLLTISAGVQGYFFRKNKIYESILLMIASLILMTPNYISSYFPNSYNKISLNDINHVYNIKQNSKIKISLQNNKFNDVTQNHEIILPVHDDYRGKITDLLSKVFGIIVKKHQNNLEIVTIKSGSYAEAKEINNLYKITKFEISNNNQFVLYLYLFSSCIIFAIILMQLKRKEEINHYV